MQFHIDNLMSSHMDGEANGIKFVQSKEKHREFGGVTMTRGNKHECLGMDVTFKDKEVTLVLHDDSIHSDMSLYTFTCLLMTICHSYISRAGADELIIYILG